MKLFKNIHSKRLISTGFTLIEMAIVLVIIGVILGGLLLTLTAQIDLRNYATTKQAMEEIKEALMGYSLSHGYLPCPAISDTDGTENRNVSGACNNRVGFLPWMELGVVKEDSWNHLYRYSVTPAYSNSLIPVALSPATARDITIQTRNTNGILVNLSNASDIPAAIISHGKNSYGGTSYGGVVVTDTSVNNNDEKTNSTGLGTAFVSREYSDVKTTVYSEYDDIVVWISPNIYLAKLVTVGKLP
ncbi:MAG: prepilin-type N-terminal cleavage/methylation domain-containing protein [Methylotenera sp.]|nr:prepilin-type N-terminal cleavage/methylation domain-containing protein [Methylotenera sp.]